MHHLLTPHCISYLVLGSYCSFNPNPAELICCMHVQSQYTRYYSAFTGQTEKSVDPDSWLKFFSSQLILILVTFFFIQNMDHFPNPSSASHNKCCPFCCLLNCFKIFFDSIDPDQTAPVLLLQEQSDLGPHCMPLYLHMLLMLANLSSSRLKQTTFSDAFFDTLKIYNIECS